MGSGLRAGLTGFFESGAGFGAKLYERLFTLASGFLGKLPDLVLGAVTALSAEDAQKALEKAGLHSYFRFVLTESVALCKADSGTMFERAMKRLHSQKDDTIVFSGSLAAIQNAKDAGFRTVAVQGSAGAADWSTMQQLATQSLAQYSELLSDSV